MRVRFLIAVVLAGLFACSDQGTFADDYLVRTVKVDGKERGYRVLLPKNRDASKKIGVMLYLHGSGSRGDDNNGQVANFESAIAPVRDKIDFVIVLPQCKTDSFWSARDMADYAIAALDATVAEFNGDTGRLYLAGFSLGGYGTWQVAAGRPGKFAALMPVAGGVVGERPIDPRDRAAIIEEVGKMLESPEPYKEIAKAIGQTPAWVFHGVADEAIPVEYARTMVKALADAGNKNVRFTEYENTGHLIFGKAIAEPGFLEWLSQQKLNAR